MNFKNYLKGVNPMTGDVFQLIGSFFKVLKHYSHNEITALQSLPQRSSYYISVGGFFNISVISN